MIPTETVDTLDVLMPLKSRAVTVSVAVPVAPGVTVSVVPLSTGFAMPGLSLIAVSVILGPDVPAITKMTLEPLMGGVEKLRSGRVVNTPGKTSNLGRPVVSNRGTAAMASATVKPPSMSRPKTV